MQCNSKMKNKDTYLITLPHAGGSSSLYKGWGKNLECQVLNIDYPGHWIRMKEPLASSFQDLKQDVINCIKQSIVSGSRAVIFGHSLGAILAWEIAPELVRYGIEICGLFLSASEDPGSFSNSKIFDLRTDKEIIPLLGYSLNDNNTKVCEQFIKIFLPILKSDLVLCKKYKNKYIHTNIHSIIIYGVDDEFIDISEISNWNKYVNVISTIELKGDHFYLNKTDNIKYICDLINHFITTHEDKSSYENKKD